MSTDIIVLVFYESTPFVRKILQGEENKGVELTGDGAELRNDDAGRAEARPYRASAGRGLQSRSGRDLRSTLEGRGERKDLTQRAPRTQRAQSEDGGWATRKQVCGS